MERVETETVELALKGDRAFQNGLQPGETRRVAKRRVSDRDAGEEGKEVCSVYCIVG